MARIRIYVSAPVLDIDPERTLGAGIPKLAAGSVNSAVAKESWFSWKIPWPRS